jgi:hypothetical protein
MFEMELHGVDIYNPVDNSILATNADKVAAWFLDSDYDGRRLRRHFSTTKQPGGSLTGKSAAHFTNEQPYRKIKRRMLTKGAEPKPEDTVSVEEEIKNPYVLEFLGLRDEYSERDLEEAAADRAFAGFSARNGQ